jgi:hypothetical protein
LHPKAKVKARESRETRRTPVRRSAHGMKRNADIGLAIQSAPGQPKRPVM